MSWTAPRTWVAGEIVTASIMNSAVRDDLRYLKGLDGVPTVESGLTIDNTGGDERLLLPLLSTAECSTVLNAEGEVAFDEQTHQVKIYNGTAVKAVISEADVDDTPVNGATTVPVSSNWAFDDLNLGTTAGDILYYTEAGVRTRLAIGTAGQRLRTNAGATAPEWAAGSATQEFFVSCFDGFGGAIQDHNGTHVGYNAVGAGGKAYCTFRIPSDFTSLTSAKIALIPTATGNFDWTTLVHFGASGQDTETHTDTQTADAQACTDDQLLELDITASFTGIAVDDIVGVGITFDAMATTTDIYVLGLNIKYS